MTYPPLQMSTVKGDVVILYTNTEKKKKKDQEMSISNLRILNIVPKSHT